MPQPCPASPLRDLRPSPSGLVALVPLVALVLLLLLARSAPAAAADLWLEPLSYRSLEADRRVGVRLFLGDWRSARVEARRPERMAGLWVQGPRGWTEVRGRGGDDPIGLAPLEGEGAHLLAWRGRPGFGRLAPAAWLRLFEESGRDPAEAPTEVEGVRYTRCAKALVLAGGSGASGDPWARPLGLELELSLLGAPHDWPSSASGGLEGLPVKLLRGDRPLAGVLLRAWCLDAAGEARAPIRARTDASGVARLDLPQRGRWVVCATALAPGDLTRWEASFTSLSFSAEAGPPVRGPAALAAVLARAREANALRPLLGVHHFRFDRRYFGPAGEAQGVDETLMTYTLSLDEEASELRVAVDVSPRGRAHAIVFEYAVDVATGRMAWLHNSEGAFAPQGGALALPGGASSVDEALLLPKVVGVFLIPQLAAALPPGSLPGALRLVDLTPFATLSRPLILRPARVGEPDHSPEVTTWVTEEGGPGVTTRVRVAGAGPFRGKLIEIQTRSEVDAAGQLRTLNDCARLSPEDYRARFRDWFGAE